MSCCFRFIADVAFSDDCCDDVFESGAVIVSLDSIQGFENSLVSMNRVFVEALDEFNLKTFRDLDLAVIPGDFVAAGFLNSFYPVVVLYAVCCVDSSK